MFLADIDIAGEPFRLQYQYGQTDSELVFVWTRQGQETLGLSKLSSAMETTPMKLSVPEELNELEISLSAICVKYQFARHTFSLKLTAEHYGSLNISYSRSDAAEIWKFALQMQGRFLLSSLPGFGESFDKEDYVALQLFSLQLARASGEIKVYPEVTLAWKLQGKETILSFPDSAPQKLAGSLSEKAEQDQPKYLEVNKDFGPFHLSRVGFAMGSSAVTLYVDAGIRLSVVMLEFIGLNFSLPLKAGGRVDYGLQGVAVSISKPPLSISGGLTLDQSGEMTLYTGEVSVQFKGIGVTALCSYGQFTQGEASLFAFFLVSARIGGPPVFYITGLAGGFGYNRSIALPDKVEEVERFPFVAAALGKGDLKGEMTPAEVLAKMDQIIRPVQGQYFFSVGVRFQTFGLMESFLLCNVEFGKAFVLSILGVSQLSMPFSAQNPLVYIRLALKAVLAPDDGVVKIEGALMEDSYILDKNCKVNGGFACYLWFGKSEHAGDFVVTLGGYRNGYNVAHYPKVDRLSINWRMDSHLTLSASAYFALTPACAMLGGNLSLVYENGRVKAWLQAWAEFFMQWEPFYYDVSIGISVGASYRWDFFPFYRTFSTELGADLELWGPPFGGQVHISWFIISFTISFGEGKPSEASLGWTDFARAFLPEGEEKSRQGGTEDQEAEKSVISIQPVAGVLHKGEKSDVYLMNADAMELEITSRIMSTELFYGDAQVAKYQGKLGIVPMGVSNLLSRLTIKITDRQGREAWGLEAQPIYTNAPKALWNSGKPQKEDTDNLISQVPLGIRLVGKKSSPSGMLPPKQPGFYNVEVLCANEKLGPKNFSFLQPDPVSGSTYSKEEVLKQIEESIAVTGGRRKGMLEELADIFGVWTEEELALSGWEKDLEKQLRAEPVLSVIGADR